MEAVTFLTEENTQEPAQDVAAAEPSTWEGSAVGKQLPRSECFTSARPCRFTCSSLSCKGKCGSFCLHQHIPGGE